MAFEPPPTVLVTTVEIGDGAAGKIEVRLGEDPATVAKAFVERHNLPSSVVGPLTQHLVDNLRKARLDNSSAAGTPVKGGHTGMASPATPQALPSDSPRIAPHSAPPASYIGPNDARFRRALEAKMVVVDPNMLAGMDDSHAHEQHQQRRLSYSTDKGPDVSQRGSVHLRLFSQAADRERRAEERRLGLEADAMADARQSATKAKMSWVSAEMMKGRGPGPFGSYGEMLYAEGLEAEAGKRRRAEAQRKERAERELIGATFSPEITPLARELRGGSDSGDPVWERLQLTQQMQSKTLAKAAQQQAAKEQHMAAECTFHPRIDARSKAMMSARSSLLRTCNVSPHEQLFQDSIRRQAKQEELSTWVPDEVTFQPAVNKDELAQKWFRRSMEGFSRSPGMPKERQVSVIDRLYASHEKAKSKLEAKRTVLQSTDPVTGQQLFQPEVNKTPRSGASTPQRARPASAGRAQRPDAPDSIYSQLYAQALESQTRKRDAAAAARAKSAGTSAQRHVNSSSDRQYARLTSERFAQVFDYLDTDCDGKIDLIAIIRAPVSRIDDLDAEVRGDVELASQAHAKANGVPLLPESFGDMGSLEAVEAALAALPPAPLVTRDAFGALMAGALRLRRGPRMYLTPTPGHSASQAPGTPEGTFSPAINARSRALAEQSLRPPGVPSHELLHAMASQVASKRATKAAEARAAELNGCTFQPALLPHAGGSAQHVRNPGPGVRSPGGGSATHTTQAPASPPPAAVRTRWNGGVASSPGRGEPGAQDLAALEREVRAALAGVQLTLSELREVIAAASVSGEGGVAEDVVRQLLASSGGRA